MKNSVFRYINPLSKSLPLRGRFRGGHALCTLIFALFSLTGCVTDSMGPCPEEVAKNERYVMTLTVITPTDKATRSYTDENGGSSDDTEVATTNESLLETANLYFVVGDDIVVTLYASGKDITAQATQGKYTLTAQIEYGDLTQLIGKSAKLYIVGNSAFFNANFEDNFSSDQTDAVFSISGVDSRPLGKVGSNGLIMPLANYEEIEVTFGESLSATPTPEEVMQAIYNLFTQSSNGREYDIPNEIKLERGVARLEYKDWNRDPQEADNSNPYDMRLTGLGANQYYISSGNVAVELSSMQVFNINKQSYLFRHTAAGNNEKATAATASLFGTENGGNGGYAWIAGSDWSFSGNTITKSASYWNKLITSSTGYSIVTESGSTALSTAGTIDMADFSNQQIISDGGYRGVCYLMENVLPSTEMMDTDGLVADATGVAFTFVILDDDKQPLTKDSENLPTGLIFLEDGETIEITTPDGYYQEFSPSDADDLYYITYYAYIKHNNPSSSVGTPPMQYGVVRNNTYQLSVKEVSKLPNPEEPKSMYLELMVNVLNWNKREVGYDF